MRQRGANGPTVLKGLKELQKKLLVNRRRKFLGIPESTAEIARKGTPGGNLKISKGGIPVGTP